MENTAGKLVILDLDETLVYATRKALASPPSFSIGNYFVYERPYLRQFLSDLAQHFTIGVRSAAGDDYVNDIVQHIKPDSVALLMVWDAVSAALSSILFMIPTA